MEEITTCSVLICDFWLAIYDLWLWASFGAHQKQLQMANSVVNEAILLLTVYYN